MLNKIALFSTLSALLFVSVNAVADDDIEKPPVIPEPLADGETIEPEVNIIHRDDRTVEEYRVNGELYMIKVIPKVGKPYYFIDTDGDGSLESKGFELQSDVIPNWILLKW